MSIIDVGDNCIECGRDTAWGSGLLVDRIPANNDEKEGWLCRDCREEECERCGEHILEYTFTEGGDLVCDDCFTDDEESTNE